MINLFTHTDLDGLGCAALMKLYAAKKYEEISVLYCDYENINQRVSDSIDLWDMAAEKGILGQQDRYIVISDISLNEETAQKLDNFCLRTSTKVILLDHHKTAVWMNEKYPWAHVVIDTEVCGTSLVYDEFFSLHREDAIDEFVDAVCLYDTWRFNPNELGLPRQLNYFTSLYGKEKFVDFAIKAMIFDDPHGKYTVRPHFCIYEELYGLIQDYDKSVNEYINRRVSQAQVYQLPEGFNVAVAVANKHFSEIGHKLIDTYTDADFAIVLDFENGSAHLRGNDRSPDLGQFARAHGGGGHPYAAAFRFKVDDQVLNKAMFGICKPPYDCAATEEMLRNGK